MLGESISSLEEVYEVLVAIAPQKQSGQAISIPQPKVGAKENLLVASFDGSARAKRKGGGCSAIIWKIPELTIVAANSKFIPNLTVNEAECRSLILSFDLLISQARTRGIICGDLNLVVRQIREYINCKTPGLQLLRHRAKEKLRSW